MSDAGPWAGLSPPYGTIVADPPWPFRWDGRPGGKHRNPTPLQYDVMTLEAIASMPVGELAADDAYLFLWVTRDLFREGHGCAIARSWGFEPSTEIIWEKPSFGMGAVPRLCHEPLLIAKRGQPPVSDDRTIRSVQRWGQRYDADGGKTHSAKPAGAGDLIEAHFPGPYLELFARQQRLGWDSWGHGYEVISPIDGTRAG